MAKLKISNKDAYDAYTNKQHLRNITAGLTAGNMPQQMPDVSVTITDDGKRATVRYGFDLSVVASDESGLDDVEELITGLLQDASSAGISASGIPSNPLQIINLTFKTIRRVRDIWEVDQRIAEIAARDLKVKIEERNGATVRLQTKIMVDASWMANDPTEWGSYAWLELEMHRITGVVEHIGSPPSDLDDLERKNGIVPWKPAHGNDLIGAFYSDVHTCQVNIDRDEFLMTADVTCNAISDDDVVALIIRSMTIELEILESAKKETGIEIEGEKKSGLEKEEEKEEVEEKRNERKSKKLAKKKRPTKIRRTDR